MLRPGAVLDIGDHTVEVLSTPVETNDRYKLRIVAQPGSPGIKGSFPHSHPALVETFECVSGDMRVRVGRRIEDIEPGQVVEVAPGRVHGFLNTGTGELIVDSEVIFPTGYNPEIDLMRFAAIYDRLRREGPVNNGTGEPPLLQMAVLLVANPQVMRQPGLAGWLIKPLATVGRLRRYRSEFPEYESG